MREAELSYLLSYLCSGENRLLCVSTGRTPGSLAGATFSAFWFQRCLLQFLCTTSSVEPIAIYGEAGVGNGRVAAQARRVPARLVLDVRDRPQVDHPRDARREGLVEAIAPLRRHRVGGHAHHVGALAYQ